MQGHNWIDAGSLGLMPSTDVLSNMLGHLFDTIPSTVTRLACLIAGSIPSAWPVHKEKEKQTRLLKYLYYGEPCP
jgi:hypothetical protein